VELVALVASNKKDCFGFSFFFLSYFLLARPSKPHKGHMGKTNKTEMIRLKMSIENCILKLTNSDFI
jgi:hypothetical protein